MAIVEKVETVVVNIQLTKKEAQSLSDILFGAIYYGDRVNLGLVELVTELNKVCPNTETRFKVLAEVQ